MQLEEATVGGECKGRLVTARALRNLGQARLAHSPGLPEAVILRFQGQQWTRQEGMAREILWGNLCYLLNTLKRKLLTKILSN